MRPNLPTMKKIFLLITCIALGACSSSMSTTMSTTKVNTPLNTEVIVLKLNEDVPTPNTKVGSSKFGDSGFSVNCNLNYILSNARKIAQDFGADVIKITKHKRPNLWSTCHRVDVDYYKTQTLKNNN